jgi:hypothetical protein
MAINVSDMHWVLLAAHVPTGTVSIVDSLSLPSSKKYLPKMEVSCVIVVFPLCYVVSEIIN